MTVAKHHDMVLLTDIDELSDDQRAGVLAYFEAHPGAGYKAALTSVGIRSGSFVAAKTFLLADEKVREARCKGWGLSEHNVMGAVGEMVADPSHKDRFNAARFAAGVLHGFAERTGVELSGANGAPVGVSVEHDFSGILDGLEQIGVLRRSEAVIDAAGLPVLPARADDAAVDRVGGAPGSAG